MKSLRAYSIVQSRCLLKSLKCAKNVMFLKSLRRHPFIFQTIHHTTITLHRKRIEKIDSSHEMAIIMTM